jgi:serine/threonine protein phosphatase PrpC
MALFDGHGTYGHVVSHAAALDMLHRLSKRKTIYPTTLTSTFLEVDKSLPHVPGSGSTAIVMVQNELQVHVANLGDSQAFIAEFNGHTQETTIIYQTQQHKPHMAAERQRIEAAGGRVMLPNKPGESSRVVIPIGEMDVALAMSRSLGDHEGKETHVLTAEPTVDTITLDPNKMYFAVAATDGIFDCLELEHVARHLGRAMYSASSSSSSASSLFDAFTTCGCM